MTTDITTTDTSTGSTTDSSKAEQAKQAAAGAADEGKHVAGVAAGEAKSVAADATQQARSVASDAVNQVRGQLDDQGRQQKDKLAGTLSTFGDDLGQMSQSSSGLAADVAREVADRAQSLSRHLEGREPSELLDDVRRFARQRPGTFLLGALAAGVVAGRLLRGTKDAVEAAEGQPSTSGDQPLTTATPPPVTSTTATPPPATGTPPPSSTGYSSPPLGTGLGGSDVPGGVTP